MLIPISILYIIVIQCIVVADGEVEPGSSLRPSLPSSSRQQQFWKSTRGNFRFGFHPDGKDGLYVLAISIADNEDKTLVWTAGENGGIRVSDKASFDFQIDGNLVLRNGTNTVVWQTNTANRSIVSAVMRDNGNFVVKNSSSSSVWESFANPTDTLLVDQNFTVGQSLHMYPYSFTLEPSGNFTLKWRNNITYWSQGALNGSRAYLDNQGIFTLSNSSGDRLWTAYSSDYTDSFITLRRTRLESDGNLRSYGLVNRSGTWQLGWSAIEDQCQVYGWCGNFGVCVYNDTSPYCICPSADFVPMDPNDPTQGCRRQQDLVGCINQSMVVLNHTRFFSYPPESDSKSDIYYLGIHDCEQNYCLRNPLCVASTVMADGSSICRIKSENFISAYQSAALPSTSYVKVCGQGHPLAPPPPAIRTVDSSKVSAIVIATAVVVPIIALITIQICLWWILCRNNTRFRFGQLPAQYTLLEYASGTPVQFSYKELQYSTRKFSEKLGSGGFGTVYKGELPNKAIVAVKRLEGIEQGERQFHMEVATISSTHHLNLVRLIGFCSEGRHRLLVYEFMKNSSLDTFLFASSEQSRMLDWDKRFGIALGTARGVTYLHEECRDCIVHCDIKPENILLDDNFNAKVSDFGLSKLINHKGHHKRTLTTVQGTRGYLAPEWLANLPISTKSDVYSYGMVLLEIISSRRNFDTMTSRRKKFSVWAFEEFERENILNITDEKLGRDINIDQVKRALQVSFWCIQEQPSQRPTMGKVVQMLEGILPIDKPPAPKYLESFESSTSASASELALSVFATSSHPVSSMSSVITTLS